jgi:TonB family protein
VVGGVIGGTLGGTGTAVATHYSQVKPKRQVSPRYPQAASDLGLGEERCIAVVFIDKKGKPTKVDVERCSSVFHAEVKRALMSWRFYPYKTGGVATEATFKMPIRFKPQ